MRWSSGVAEVVLWWCSGVAEVQRCRCRDEDVLQQKWR